MNNVCSYYATMAIRQYIRHLVMKLATLVILKETRGSLVCLVTKHKFSKCCMTHLYLLCSGLTLLQIGRHFDKYKSGAA